MAQYDLLVISPHLDDAVLSCGGTMFRAALEGARVLAVTVFTGDAPAGHRSPFAGSFEASWGLGEDATRVRRAEDAAACAIVGATTRHLPFVDAIYRVDPDTREPLYTSSEALFGTLRACEGELTDSVARALRALSSALAPAHRVLAPLALGDHVDHQITRRAAERAFGPTLRYYEDFPYVVRGNVVGDGALDRWSATRAGHWGAEVTALAPSAVDARVTAIAAYTSQIPAIFGDGESMEATVRDYVAACGGERTWARAVPTTNA
jgi:LmbE family N-acetylglucosaminyl deacetylase